METKSALTKHGEKINQVENRVLICYLHLFFAALYFNSSVYKILTTIKGLFWFKLFFLIQIVHPRLSATYRESSACVLKH
jgi:hypothetical protein